MTETAARPNVLFLVEVVNCNDGIASYCETLATGMQRRGVNIYLVSGQVRSDEKSEYKRRKLEAAVEEWHEIAALRKLPSLSITRLEPTGRGAEPQVSTTVASATPRPSFAQVSAALRMSSSRESIGVLRQATLLSHNLGS